MNSIRERIIREIIRRIETKEFEAVTFDRVIRSDLPDDYTGDQGSILSVTEGTEVFSPQAGREAQSDLEVFMSFAIPLAANEVAATTSNNVAAAIIKALAGQHTLNEGGDGEPLSVAFSPVSIQPNVLLDGDECATGVVEFRLMLRTAIHDPFRRRQ